MRGRQQRAKHIFGQVIVYLTIKHANTPKSRLVVFVKKSMKNPQADIMMSCVMHIIIKLMKSFVSADCVKAHKRDRGL